MLFYTKHCSHPNFFIDYLSQQGRLTSNAESADFLVLPFMYEYIHDFAASECKRYNISEVDILNFRTIATELDDLSVKLQKKLIVFFYRDPVSVLPFSNPVVFRTSAYKSKLVQPTYGLPAFIEHKPFTQVPHTLPYTSKPIISFRGTVAPLRLPFGIGLRDWVNHSLLEAGFEFRLHNWYPKGYLLRRRALLSCMRMADFFHTDFVFNPSVKDANYSSGYTNSLQQAHYFICAAGFGNYSYRLYEVMRAGRIPVLIESDQLLPAETHICWKKLAVTVPEAEVNNTGEILKDFHSSIHPDDFEAMQLRVRDHYDKYFTKEGFAKYLLNRALPDLIKEEKE
jgi:hypothetical protein